MKFSFNINLVAGELVEIKVPFVFGSQADKNFRKKLSDSIKPTLINLVDMRESKRDFLSILKSDEMFLDLDVASRLAIELLRHSNKSDIIIFSILGQGDRGIRLILEITKFMRSSGSKFILIDYDSSGVIPDSDFLIFQPTSTLNYSYT